MAAHAAIIDLSTIICTAVGQFHVLIHIGHGVTRRIDMNYVTGKTIKELRENRHLTQKELAEQIGVSDKAISKWETDRGLPDIGIIEYLAKALGISITELLTGDLRRNENRSANMKKLHFYVCPLCGNIITSLGQGSYSCCGITLPELEAESCSAKHTEDSDGEQHIAEHTPLVETIEHEYFISMDHPMSKAHYISFVAYVTSDNLELIKLYPEQDVAVRFKKKGSGFLYLYCNKHGLFRMPLPNK